MNLSPASLAPPPPKRRIVSALGFLALMLGTAFVIWLSPLYQIRLQLGLTSEISHYTKFYIPIGKELLEESTLEHQLRSGYNKFSLPLLYTPDYIRWDPFYREIAGARIKLETLDYCVGPVRIPLRMTRLTSPYQLEIEGGNTLKASAGAEDPQIRIDLHSNKFKINTIRILLCLATGALLVLVAGKILNGSKPA